MESDCDILRLSDLVRLCASTMRTLARQRAHDGAGGAALELAGELDRIAREMRFLSTHPGVAKNLSADALDQEI